MRINAMRGNNAKRSGIRRSVLRLRYWGLRVGDGSAPVQADAAIAVEARLRKSRVGVRNGHAGIAGTGAAADSQVRNAVAVWPRL